MLHQVGVSFDSLQCFSIYSKDANQTWSLSGTNNKRRNCLKFEEEEKYEQESGVNDDYNGREDSFEI